MTTKLMTNIDSSYYYFLDKEAKEKKITKRQLLEYIIGEYIKSKKSQELKNAYLKMGKDKEYLKEMEENTKYLSNL